jgi:hypothetical protein
MILGISLESEDIWSEIEHSVFDCDVVVCDLRGGDEHVDDVDLGEEDVELGLATVCFPTLGHVMFMHVSDKIADVVLYFFSGIVNNRLIESN